MGRSLRVYRTVRADEAESRVRRGYQLVRRWEGVSKAAREGFGGREYDEAAEFVHEVRAALERARLDQAISEGDWEILGMGKELTTQYSIHLSLRTTGRAFGKRLTREEKAILNRETIEQDQALIRMARNFYQRMTLARLRERYEDDDESGVFEEAFA